jgi:hypothetical protein
MAAMTPKQALEEFLDDDNLRAVAQPITEALEHPTANIDQFASSIDKSDYHNFYRAYFQALGILKAAFPMPHGLLSYS